MSVQFAYSKIAQAFPKAAYEISAHFAHNDFELYAVGGAVRDALIGREVHDIDFATNALPEDVMRICKRTIATGLQHGTITVLWNGESFEITTYRTDQGYSNFRQPDSVSFTTSLVSDLARRDFTINAVALDLNNGALHDPYEGQADMARKLIRCVGTPSARFTEDGLRMMRCVRFATTLSFEIDAPSINAIRECAHLIQHISRERIAQELQKILRSLHAEKGYVLLQETHLYSFIFSNAAAAHEGNAHDYAYTDTALLLRAIDHVPFMPNEKMREVLAHAALFLPKRLEKNEAVAKAAAERANEAYTTLKLRKRDLSRILLLLRSNDIMLYKKHSGFSQRRLRLLITLIGLEHAYDLLVFHMAQRSAWSGTVSMEQLGLCGEYLRECIAAPGSVVQSPAELRISGSTIAQHLQRKPGKWLGDLKKTLMRWVSVHPEKNDPCMLLEYVTSMKIP